MSDPSEGFKLRLGYEVAREIERTPIISLGVQDAATKAINSVLYQRLPDQIIVDNPTLIFLFVLTQYLPLKKGAKHPRHARARNCLGALGRLKATMIENREYPIPRIHHSGNV